MSGTAALVVSICAEIGLIILAVVWSCYAEQQYRADYWQEAYYNLLDKQRKRTDAKS